MSVMHVAYKCNAQGYSCSKKEVCISFLHNLCTHTGQVSKFQRRLNMRAIISKHRLCTTLICTEWSLKTMTGILTDVCWRTSIIDTWHWKAQLCCLNHGPRYVYIYRYRSVVGTSGVTGAWRNRLHPNTRSRVWHEAQLPNPDVFCTHTHPALIYR